PCGDRDPVGRLPTFVVSERDEGFQSGEPGPIASRGAPRAPGLRAHRPLEGPGGLLPLCDPPIRPGAPRPLPRPVDRRWDGTAPGRARSPDRLRTPPALFRAVVLGIPCRPARGPVGHGGSVRRALGVPRDVPLTTRAWLLPFRRLSRRPPPRPRVPRDL